MRSGSTNRNVDASGVPATRAVANARPRRGAATVELAVLLPVIAFLFVIAVDYARVFYYSQVIENCARQGRSTSAIRKPPRTTSTRTFNMRRWPTPRILAPSQP
jgi:Flp pilus assembly protein TadG